MSMAMAVLWLFCCCFFLLLYKSIDRLLRRPRVRGGYYGRHVLVTGCDSGFGREFVLRLEHRQCNVFAGCLTEKGEDELRKSCSKTIHPFRLDVSKPESVQKAFEFVKTKLPPGEGLWGLVNNAGVIGPRGRLEWAKLEDYKSVNSVNLYGMVDVTMTFLPLIKMARGRVVNTCSLAGRIAVPESSPYTVSKFAAEAFSDVLRRSLAIYGCKVSIIEPGGFQTNINTVEANRRLVMSAWNGASQEIKEEFGEEYLHSTIDSIQSIELETNLDLVVNAYEEALFCRFPRARYVVGRQGKFVSLFPLLPEWLSDWVLEKIRRGSKTSPVALSRKRQ